ncbi:MAG: hypothetical protein ACE5NW_02180 [Acidiferrobacterales bacterium]
MATGERASTGKRDQHLRIHGRGEAQEIIAGMLAQARHKVSIFSPTLDGYLFNTAPIAKALASFAAAHRKNLVRFLIEDVDQSLHHNARIVELCRRLSDFIKIRAVDEDHAGLQEMFLIIDDNAYLHQPDTQKQDYIAGFEGTRKAKHFANQHEHMWECSLAITAIHKLGL